MLFPTVIEKEETSTSTDVLASTEFDPVPGNGKLYVWVASTVNTATLEVPQANHRTGITQLIRKRTDGIPSIKEDQAFVVPCKAGTHPVLVLGGTTGTVHFTVGWKPR